MIYMQISHANSPYIVALRKIFTCKFYMHIYRIQLLYSMLYEWLVASGNGAPSDCDVLAIHPDPWNEAEPQLASLRTAVLTAPVPAPEAGGTAQQSDTQREWIRANDGTRNESDRRRSYLYLKQKDDATINATTQSEEAAREEGVPLQWGIATEISNTTTFLVGPMFSLRFQSVGTRLGSRGRGCHTQ